MEIIKNNKAKRLIFSLIWCFFLIRLTKLLNFDFQNLFKTLIDITSLFIFLGLIIYVSLNFFAKKKISKITYLIVYPIIGLIAYHVNGFQNDFQDRYLIHHFITLSSIFLYFSIIQSDRVFDYKFNENLLKISLVFCIIFCLFNVIPAILVKIYSYESLRITTATVIKFFGNEVVFHQNINGQAKFLFIIFMLCFFLFKNYLFNKKNISYLFFTFSILFVTIIFLTQSRLNILASFVFSFFFLLMIKNLSLGRKLVYFLLILIIPISVFNFYTDITKNRFSDSALKIYTDNDKVKNFVINEDNLNNELVKLLEIDIKEPSYNTEILSNSALVFDNYKFHKDKIIYNNASSFHEEYLIYHHMYKLIDDNFNKNGSIKSSFSESKIDENNDKIVLQKYLFDKKRDLYKLFLLSSCSNSIRFIDALLTGRVCGWQILWNSINVKELILGKGFFADQVFLKPLEKVSSNSLINILYNAGIISLSIYLIILTIFFTKYFKIKNLKNENLYFSLSHYLILYFLFRSIFEDTLAFVSIDLLIFSLCLSLISQKFKEKNN